jgi:hypothetical protein
MQRGEFITLLAVWELHGRLLPARRVASSPFEVTQGQRHDGEP